MYHTVQELANTYENANDRWRALGYQKAIMTLRKHPKPVTSWDVSYCHNDMNDIPGIYTYNLIFMIKTKN